MGLQPQPTQQMSLYDRDEYYSHKVPDRGEKTKLNPFPSLFLKAINRCAKGHNTSSIACKRTRTGWANPNVGEPGIISGLSKTSR